MYSTVLREYVCICWILIWKKVKYTHITSSEQGTVRLRHIHVVVVILELQRKTKTHNEPTSVQITSSATRALPFHNGHLSLKQIVTLGSECLPTELTLFSTCTSAFCHSAIIVTWREACERPRPIQAKVMRICSGYSALMGWQLRICLHHKAKYQDAVAGY